MLVDTRRHPKYNVFNCPSAYSVVTVRVDFLRRHIDLAVDLSIGYKSYVRAHNDLYDGILYLLPENTNYSALQEVLC